MKTRRELLLALPFVGLFLGTPAESAEAGPGGPVLPYSIIEKFGLRPARGRGLLASNVVVPGEDGQAYPLLDVMAAMHWRGKG